jgi:hypothetical protein
MIMYYLISSKGEMMPKSWFVTADPALRGGRMERRDEQLELGIASEMLAESIAEATSQ